MKLFTQYSQFENILKLDLNELVPDAWTELSKAMRMTKKWDEIIFFLIVKLTTVCGMSPKVLLSLYFYYVEDLGRDSFELPLSMWYVHR